MIEGEPPGIAAGVLESELRAANARHYGDDAAVRSYLERPYHRLRRELALRLLVEELKAAFPSSRPGALTVLELGAADGGLTSALARHGLHAVAADIEPGALRGARQHGVACVGLDAARGLPFADAAFAAVLMCELIEHVFDTRMLLAELRRVLRGGGVVVLTTPNLATLQDRLRFLAGHAPRQVDPLHEYLYLHVRPFSYQSLARALSATGFGRFRLKSNHVVLRRGERTLFEIRWLARLFPRLGGSLVIAARKLESEA